MPPKEVPGRQEVRAKAQLPALRRTHTLHRHFRARGMFAIPCIMWWLLWSVWWAHARALSPTGQFYDVEGAGGLAESGLYVVATSEMQHASGRSDDSSRYAMGWDLLSCRPCWNWDGGSMACNESTRGAADRVQTAAALNCGDSPTGWQPGSAVMPSWPLTNELPGDKQKYYDYHSYGTTASTMLDASWLVPLAGLPCWNGGRGDRGSLAQWTREVPWH